MRDLGKISQHKTDGYYYIRSMKIEGVSGPASGLRWNHQNSIDLVLQRLSMRHVHLITFILFVQNHLDVKIQKMFFANGRSPKQCVRANDQLTQCK